MTTRFIDMPGHRIELVVPTVHLNGTSKGGLLGPLRAAYLALENARIALAETAPHGRDYYVQRHFASEEPHINQAIEQHNDRLRRIEAVKAEIETLYLAVDEQG